MNERKTKFEKWFLAQFGDDKKGLLEYEKERGYLDASTSCMWFGFNAGIESKDW